MPTYISQPDETNGYDTYLRSDYPTFNYGTASAMLIGEHKNFSNLVNRGLIRFDLSSIPTNAAITSATLSLTIAGNSSDNARNYKVYRVLRNWGETSASWSVYDGTNNWTSAGCGSAGNDYDSTVWATTYFTASESAGTVKNFTLDTTEFTKIINGTYPNYGWLIKADTEVNDAYTFASSGNSTPSYRPKLTVEYEITENNSFLVMF